MRLTTEKGELLLPDDFKLEITANHPFFSDEGTASAPLTLPPIANNRQQLQDPENPNRAQRYGRIFKGTISHATYSRPCSIIVAGGSRKAGIDATVALQESEMYANLQERKLPDLLSEFQMSVGHTPWEYYHNVSLGTSSPFTFFPVATDKEEQDGVVSVFVMNQPEKNGKFTTNRQVKIGDTTAWCQTGYGITPFLYLWAVIQMSFQYCGYNVTENVFATDEELRHIVVLNRCADALLSEGHPFNPSPAAGTNETSFYIRGDILVPNITMGELITWLRDKFGAFVTVNDKSVSVRLLRDVIAAGYDEDLSGYAQEKPSVTYPEPRTLRYEQGTGIDGSDPAAESLEALREAYPATADVDVDTDIQGAGLFHVSSLGKYYYKETDESTPKLVGSEAVAFARNMDMEEEALEPDDSFVPMVYHPKLKLFMPYLGERDHRILDVTGKEKAADLPIMVCCANYFINSESVVHCVGTTTDYRYDTPLAGFAKRTPLTPEGIVPKYFRDYWAILADGAPELQCSLKIPLNVLGKIDMFTPKLLNGSLVLIKSLKYTLSAAGLSACDATLQLLPDYDDTTPIPQILFNANLVWGLVSTRTVYDEGTTSNGIRVKETDGVADYTMANAPSYPPTKVGQIAKSRDRWLKYTRYSSGFLWWSSQDCTHNYKEYFVGKLQDTQ